MNGKIYFAFTTGCDWGSGNLKACVYADIIDAAFHVTSAQATMGNSTEWWWFPSFAPQSNGNGTIASANSDGSTSPNFVVSGITGNATPDGVAIVQLGSTQPYIEPGALSSTNCIGTGSCYRWGDFFTSVTDPSGASTWAVGDYASADGATWLTGVTQNSE